MDRDSTYGLCRKPFGTVRIRAVEFLAEAYKAFSGKDLHQAMADTELYDALLHYFETYPFHNILHQRVNEIFQTAMERNQELAINHILYGTTLIRRILETSRESGIFVFSSQQTINRGFMIFIRKLANRLVELKGHNEEVSNFLESIPEWAEFEQGSLARSNAIENRPLASDPRKRGN